MDQSAYHSSSHPVPHRSSFYGYRRGRGVCDRSHLRTEASNGLWRRGGPFGGNADCGRKRKPREKFPAAGPGGNPRRKRGKKTLPNAFFFLPFFKRWRRRGLTAAVYKREHPSRPGPTHPTRVSNSPQSVQGNPFDRRLFHLFLREKIVSKKPFDNGVPQVLFGAPPLGPPPLGPPRRRQRRR